MMRRNVRRTGPLSKSLYAYRGTAASKGKNFRCWQGNAPGGCEKKEAGLDH